MHNQSSIMFCVLYFGFLLWSLIPYLILFAGRVSGLNQNMESDVRTERFRVINNQKEYYEQPRNYVNSKLFKRGKVFKMQPRFDKSSNVSPDMYSSSENIPYTNPDEEDAFTKNLINALTKNDNLLLKGSKYDIESLVSGGLNNLKNNAQQSGHNRETHDKNNQVFEKEEAVIDMDKHNIHSKEHGISSIPFNEDSSLTYNHKQGDSITNSHDEVESTINKYLYSDDVKNDLLSDNVPLDSSIKNEVLKYMDQEKPAADEKPETDEKNPKIEGNEHFKHYEHELKIGAEEGEKNDYYNKFVNQPKNSDKFENEFFFDNKLKNDKDNFEDGSKHSSLNEYSEKTIYQNDLERNFPEYHTKETNYLSNDQRQDENRSVENESGLYEKYGETHEKIKSNNEPSGSTQIDTNAEKKFQTNPSNKVLDNAFFKHSVEGELLDEYKHYPNEYLTKEESLLESEKNVNQMQDAVKLDNEGLNNELSAISEEEERIGTIFDKKNKSLQNPNEYGALTGSHYNDGIKQIQENYIRVDSQAKKFNSEEKKVDDYEEFDNETKELLNIDVRVNGKIVDTNGQHANSKEEVLDQDISVPYMQAPLNSSISSKNMTSFQNASNLKLSSSKLEENMLLKEINNLQNELQITKPKIITSPDLHLIVKKNFFTKRSENLKSKAKQNNQDMKVLMKNIRNKKKTLIKNISYESQDETRIKRNTKIRQRKKSKNSASSEKNDVKVKNITSNSMDIYKNKYQTNRKHSESLKPGANYGVLGNITGGETSNSTEKNYTDEILTINSMNNLHFKKAIDHKISNIYTRRDSIEKSREGKSLQVVIKSIGCFDPPFHGSNCDATLGSIVIDGVEISPNRPGFNIVVIDLKTGELEQATSFDTHGEAGAFKKLVNLLLSLEMWKIICIAVKDDAESYLPDSALHVFERIGAQGIAKQKIEYRSSYAFVGLSGPESARNKLKWLQEESNRAGDGPSIIVAHIKTGLNAFEEAGGRIFETKIKVPINFYKSSATNADEEDSRVSLEKNDFERRVKVSNSNKSVDESVDGLFQNTDDSHLGKNNDKNIQHKPNFISDNQKHKYFTNASDTIQTKSEKLSDIELQIHNLKLALSQEKQNYKKIVEMVMTQSSPDNLNFLNSIKNNLHSSLIENINPVDHQSRYPGTTTIANIQSNLLDKNIAAENIFDNQNHNQGNVDNANVVTNLKLNDQFAEDEPERKKSHNNDFYSEKQLDNAAENAAVRLIQSFQNSASKEQILNSPPVENFLKASLVENILKTPNVENFNAVSSLSKLSNAFNVLDGSENVNETDSSRLDEADTSRFDFLLKNSDKSSLNRIENNLINTLKSEDLNPSSQLLDKDDTSKSFPENVGTTLNSQTKYKDDATSKTPPYSLANHALFSLINQAMPAVTRNYQEVDNSYIPIGIGSKTTNYQNLDNNTNEKELSQSVLYKLIQDLLQSQMQSGNLQTNLKSNQFQSDSIEALQSFKKNVDGNKQFEVINSLGSSIYSGVPNPAYDSSVDKVDSAILKSDSSHDTIDIDSQYTGQGPFGSISQANVKKKLDFPGNSSLVDTSLIKQVIEKIPNETVQKLVNLIKEKLTYELQNKIHSPPSLESKYSKHLNKDECEQASKVCEDECYKKNTLIGRYINIQSTETKAVIKVNGQDWSKDEDGFNLVVLDFFTGEVDSTESFDTEVDGGASRAMTNFINSLAPGKLLLVATRGNAGEFMSNNGYTALALTGARSLLNNHLNSGDRYVLLGATGNLRSLIQEDFVQYGSDIAEIKAPIVIGPGAMNDTCLCLKYCGANEFHRNIKEDHRSKGSEKEYDFFAGKKPVTSDLVAKTVHVKSIKPSENNDKFNKESYDESYSQQLINNLLSSEFSSKPFKTNNKVLEKNITYSSYVEPENEASGYFGTDNAEKKSGSSLNAKKRGGKSNVSLKSKNSDEVTGDIEFVDSDDVVLPVSLVEKDLSSGDELDKSEIIFLKQNEQVASIPLKNHIKLSPVSLEHHGQISLRKKHSYQSVTPGKKLVDNLLKALHSVKKKTNKKEQHKNSHHMHPVVKEQGLSLLTKYNIDFNEIKVDPPLKKKEIEKQVKKMQHYDDVYSTIGNNLHS